MKGKIDSDGFLSIYRGDANPDCYQHQYCPFQTNSIATPSFELSTMKPCGLWCPHFSEPEYVTVERLLKKDGEVRVMDASNKRVIQICHGKELFFDELIQEQGSK